jgi:hypothetical protein
MPMSTTSIPALDTLFRSTIAGLTPRTTYKGAEAWKPYKRPTDVPTTTRRFTIEWLEAETQQLRGNFTPAACEFSTPFRVLTDYAGQHEFQQWAITEDTQHLALNLAQLRGATNGIYHVEAVRREQITSSKSNADVVQIGHVLRVRYLRSIP